MKDEIENRKLSKRKKFIEKKVHEKRAMIKNKNIK